MRLVMLAAAIAVSISQAVVNPLSQADLKAYLEKGAPFDFVLIDLRGVSEITAGIGNAQVKPYNLVSFDHCFFYLGVEGIGFY
jgi:hypothetical protein